MTDLNQAQTKQVIKDLNEYADAQAELQQAKTFGHVANEGPDRGHNRRLEAAQLRYDAALAKIPSREQAEAACLLELQQMAAQWEQARTDLLAAVIAEMEAWIAREAKNIRLRYANAEPILGLSVHDATRAAHQAQEIYNTVEYQKRVAENRFGGTYKRMGECGADPRNPEHFPAAAARRVENLLGEVYDKRHLAGVKSQFGITDKMLARMGTT